MNYSKQATKQKIKSAHSKAPKYRTKFLLTFVKIFTALILLGCFTGAGIGIGMVKGIIDNAPDVDILSIGPSGFATKVYDREGNLTDTLVQSGSNREAATYDELPQDLVDAFVAIEDSRFWSHNGIDFRSIMRAVAGVLTSDYAGGGSTLTQQLIKNNVFDGGRETSKGALMERKLQEQYLAVQLEKQLQSEGKTKRQAKEQIITDYLNTINLGTNTLGVKVAAKRYFNKDVSELTLSECTVIAGITQSPSRLNPITGREANEEKRKVILQYMVDQEYITKDEQEEALQDNVYDRIQDVNLVSKDSSSPYSYFTDELTQQVKDALKEQLGYTETQAHNLLYSGGLTIQTTQDPRIQAIVDEEINNPENYTVEKYAMEYRLSITHADGETEHFSERNIESWHKNVLGESNYNGLYSSKEKIQEDIDAYKAYLLKEGDEIIGESLHTTLQPQASFVIMDQYTGQVLAISGGRGEKTDSLTLNRATNVTRQPGSTFKVISSFAPALDTCGATLGTVYYDAPYTVGTKTFRNWYGEKYYGYSTIREGIVYSMNLVAVRCLMETVTPQLGVEYAKRMGITTMSDNDYVPSVSLGGLTNGVTNLDLTSAFASIANKGVYTKPLFFTKILDHNGKVLIDNTPESQQVLKESTAFLLTDAMADSIQGQLKYASPGLGVNPTSGSARLSGMSAAGKSGTTTSSRDIWFVGYTPYYTAGIWGGIDNNTTLSGNGGTSYHKHIWRKIMTRVHEGMSDPGFPVPDSIETAQICRKSGKLAVSGVCSLDPRGDAVYTEYFAKGTVPTEVCDKHVLVNICPDSGGAATEYCPSKESAVRMNLPAGDASATDDATLAIPAACTIHTANGTIMDPDATTEGGFNPLGPGYSITKPSETVSSPTSPVITPITEPGRVISY